MKSERIFFKYSVSAAAKKGATAIGIKTSSQSKVVSITTEIAMTHTESKRFSVIRAYRSLNTIVSRFMVVINSPIL